MKGVTEFYGLEPSLLPISIHTPVKGVTVQEQIRDALRGISIHTPVKGVTSMVIL